MNRIGVIHFVIPIQDIPRNVQSNLERIALNTLYVIQETGPLCLNINLYERGLISFCQSSINEIIETDIPISVDELENLLLLYCMSTDAAVAYLHHLWETHMREL